jgi:hypothetical protein
MWVEGLSGNGGGGIDNADTMLTIIQQGTSANTHTTIPYTFSNDGVLVVLAKITWNAEGFLYLTVNGTKIVDHYNPTKTYWYLTYSAKAGDVVTVEIETNDEYYVGYYDT